MPSPRMFAPGLHIKRPSSTTRPVAQPLSNLCHCSCHPPQKPPPAVEARLCQECADERFAAWQSLVDVLMRDD